VEIVVVRSECADYGGIVRAMLDRVAGACQEMPRDTQQCDSSETRRIIGGKRFSNSSCVSAIKSTTSLFSLKPLSVPGGNVKTSPLKSDSMFSRFNQLCRLQFKVFATSAVRTLTSVRAAPGYEHQSK
jgi:hypothetical protein